MALIDVTVKLITDLKLYRVFINGKRLRFDNNNECIIKLGDQKEHSLTWHAEGPQGKNFKLEITSPLAQKWIHSIKIDATNIDGGIHWIVL